jgi:hypothetical protein
MQQLDDGLGNNDIGHGTSSADQPILYRRPLLDFRWPCPLLMLARRISAPYREALPEVPPFPAQWSAVPGPIAGAELPGLVAACWSGAAGTCWTAAEGYLRCHYAKRHLGEAIRTSLWIIRLDAHVGREGTMRYCLKKLSPTGLSTYEHGEDKR